MQLKVSYSSSFVHDTDKNGTALLHILLLSHNFTRVPKEGIDKSSLWNGKDLLPWQGTFVLSAFKFVRFAPAVSFNLKLLH